MIVSGQTLLDEEKSLWPLLLLYLWALLSYEALWDPRVGGSDYQYIHLGVPGLNSFLGTHSLLPCSVSLIYLLFDPLGVADDSKQLLFSPTQVVFFRLQFQ